MLILKVENSMLGHILIAYMGVYVGNKGKEH